MSLRKWTVREYRPEDLIGVQELYAEVFHEPRPISHFVWKFNDNPAGRGIITVAEDSGRIVGHGALMPTPLRVGSESVRGAQGVDAMTHPDYRNQGMFVTLSEACVEQAAAKKIEMLYALSWHSGVYDGAVHKLNWDYTGAIPYFTRILNSNAVTGRLRRVRRLVSLGLHLLPIGNNSPRGVEVRGEKPSDEEMVSLAELVNSGVTFPTCSVQRSVDWFRWRFAPESQRRYVWSSAYRNGKLEAWAAFGINYWGELPIIDMTGSNPHSLEAVVSAATRQAKKLGVPALIAYTNEENAIQAMKSCGYLRHGSIPLVVRSLTSRILKVNIHLHSSWRIASEDFDTF